MAADQQFCLRWNNHQATLISVFDTLLNNGTLVDCTLAAEGQLMKAHKVVLSACSPYFELLLSQHYDKHPIVVLKDVKFQELKAIMDYMYRGEVNISQDHLSSLLKVAESLQIKGLSESGGGDNEKVTKQDFRKRPAAPPPRTPSTPVENRRNSVTQPTPINAPAENTPVAQKPLGSREECASPTVRKRKKHRQYSSSDDGNSSSIGDGFEMSNSTELPSQSSVPNSSNLPASITSVPVRPSPVSQEEIRPQKRIEKPATAESATNSAPPPPPTQVNIKTDTKLEPTAEVMVEPKTEYIENEDSVEDLTLDDDEEEMDLSDLAQAGPSHGGDGSNEGFASSWHVSGDQSQDELFLQAQEAVAGQRDSQGNENEIGWNLIPHGLPKIRVRNFNFFTEEKKPGFHCPLCKVTYKQRRSLVRHLKGQCKKEQEPQPFMYDCPYCPIRSKKKSNMKKHILTKHMGILPH